MELIFDWFVGNFPTLMILLAIVVLIIMNRHENIPAASLFALGAGLMIAVTVSETVSVQAELAGKTPFLKQVHTVSDALRYTIRPFIILIELFIIVPDKKLRIVYSFPAVINTIIFSTALFGSKVAFYIDHNNHWQGGIGTIDLHYSVYICQLIYVLLLLIHSILFFRQKRIKQSMMVLLIFVQSVTVALLELMNAAGNATDIITALCILEYYIYLSTVYMRTIRDEAAEKEIELMKSELAVLRGQVQPHFIYNTLGMIRYLAKHDGKAAAHCIDGFSKYLRAHLNALESDDLIPFEQELDNVREYIELMQEDYTRKLDVTYDIAITDFMIPPLALEPIVENALIHGMRRDGGSITISTRSGDNFTEITVSDTGTGDVEQEEYTLPHNGIGLENTRRRLELQCGGTLELNISKNGAAAVIRLPEKVRE